MEDSPTVYEFEERFPWANHNNATLAFCRDAVRAACLIYGVEPPVVGQHNSRFMSWCMPSIRKISLQAGKPGDVRGGKNISVALHEATHQIVYDLCGDRADDHGPTFCGIYFYLLEQAGWPRAAIYAVARECKVRWVARPPKWFQSRKAK